MIEKELAYLAFEVTGLLTKIFLKNAITLEAYIDNTIHKVRYLEDYIKKNQSNNDEVMRITELLTQYNKITAPARPSLR